MAVTGQRLILQTGEAITDILKKSNGDERSSVDSAEMSSEYVLSKGDQWWRQVSTEFTEMGCNHSPTVRKTSVYKQHWNHILPKGTMTGQRLVLQE